MATTVVGFDGLRVASAFGVRSAIVASSDARVRVERAVPIEVTREEFNSLADERRVTRFTSDYVTAEDHPAIVYVDWGTMQVRPSTFAACFGATMAESTARIERLLPDGSTVGPDFMLLVLDRSAVGEWAARLFDRAIRAISERPVESVRECWALIQWLEFVAAYAGPRDGHRSQLLYAWMLALAKTGQVPNVPAANVMFDLELHFSVGVRPAVERESDRIVKAHLTRA